MFNITKKDITANTPFYINNQAPSFMKVSFSYGTLSVNGYVTIDNATKSSVISLIGDKTFVIVESTTDTSQIYTIDITGYEYVTFGADCSVFLYTEAH